MSTELYEKNNKIFYHNIAARYCVVLRSDKVLGKQLACQSRGGANFGQARGILSLLGCVLIIRLY